MPGFDRSTSTINTLVEGGLLPLGSIFTIWINDTTALGANLQQVLLAEGRALWYGVLTIEHLEQSNYFLKLDDFYGVETLKQKYSKVNNVGWASRWVLVQHD